MLNTQDKNEMVKHFETLDTNGDGMLSKEELIDGEKKMRKKKIKLCENDFLLVSILKATQN